MGCEMLLWRRQKKWSGHTSNVCEDEKRWDLERVASFLFRLLRIREILERVTRVDLLILWLMVHWFIRAVEAENYLVMDTFECDHWDTFRDNGDCRRCASTSDNDRHPFPIQQAAATWLNEANLAGEESMIFSDPTWRLKKKTWKPYNITNHWTYFDLILNEKRRCWYIHKITFVLHNNMRPCRINEWVMFDAMMIDIVWWFDFGGCVAPWLSDPICQVVSDGCIKGWNMLECFFVIWAPAKTSDILEQLHQDIDTWYHHETLRNDRGNTKNDDSWYTCSPDFIANIKSSGTMRDTQKTMTISATSFRGCNRFSPLLIWISYGFHMIFIHVVLCFLRFSKTLDSLKC